MSSNGKFKIESDIANTSLNFPETNEDQNENKEKVSWLTLWENTPRGCPHSIPDPYTMVKLYEIIGIWKKRP